MVISGDWITREVVLVMEGLFEHAPLVHKTYRYRADVGTRFVTGYFVSTPEPHA